MGFPADSKQLCVVASQVLKVLLLLLLLLPASGFTSPGPFPGMDFVEIPEGTVFMFNRMEDQFGEVIIVGEPVSVRGFEMMTTEVTQDLWQQVMGELTFDVPADSEITGLGSDYPMVYLSLNKCLEFVDSLNSIDTSYIYKLPTNLEWVYACRAGTYTPFYWGDDSLMTISHHCWFLSNSEGIPHPVGTKAPNQWGLYDMCGNVMEWCLYGNGYELEDPVTGLMVCQHPLRGGSWMRNAFCCLADIWVLADSAYRDQDTGFRVVRCKPLSIYRPAEENRCAVFGEGALSIGMIQHNFVEDDIEQFGYDVKRGCQEDGLYLRGGLGKHFGRFSAFLYGELGYLTPGSLLDQHGPYILPEVLLDMTMYAGGLELRYTPARIRFGYGSYNGTAEVDLDTVGIGPSGSWTTDIMDGRGFHIGVGLLVPRKEWVGLGLEYVQHFITLKLRESGTGVEPTEHKATQYELRFFATFQLPFDLL